MADVEDYSTTAASNTDDFPEGQLPGTLNDGGRTTQADIAAWHQRTDGVITAGGTADALTVTYSPAHTSLVDGRIIVVQAASDNTSTTPTLNLDSLGAQTITKFGTEALVAGDIQANAFHIFKYDATNTNWELLNPSTPAAGSVAYSQLNLSNDLVAGDIAADAIGDSEINWNFTTESSQSVNGANWIIPAGMYWIWSDTTNTPLYATINSALRTVSLDINAEAQLVVSDGTNFRVNQTATATVYYRKMA